MVFPKLQPRIRTVCIEDGRAAILLNCVAVKHLGFFVFAILEALIPCSDISS